MSGVRGKGRQFVIASKRQSFDVMNPRKASVVSLGDLPHFTLRRSVSIEFFCDVLRFTV